MMREMECRERGCVDEYVSRCVNRWKDVLNLTVCV
jgi:hypothetical protein